MPPCPVLSVCDFLFLPQALATSSDHAFEALAEQRQLPSRWFVTSDIGFLYDRQEWA
jgi:hypothetical protein